MLLVHASQSNGPTKTFGVIFILAQTGILHEKFSLVKTH
jgi:hypothetical protein